MSDDQVDVESVKVVDSPTRESAPMLPEHAGNGTGNGGGVRGETQKMLPGGRGGDGGGEAGGRREEKGGWVGKLVSFLIVVAMLVGGYFAYPYAKGWLEGGAGKTKPPQRAAPVVLAKVRRGDLPIYLDEIGTVTALNTVVVHTRVDGQLDKLGFTEGQMVEEGQVLAELDRRPFEVQLAQAQGQMARDMAVLENAQSDLKKYTDAGNAVSRQQVDNAAALVRQAQGNIESDNGAIASAKLNIGYCTVTSPLSGKIGLRVVDRGNIVHASDPNGLAVITQVQPIAVLFSISQDDVPPVIRKMNAGEKLLVDAFDRGLVNKLATGTLEATESQMDQTTGNLRFKAVFGNEEQALFPNQFVNVRVLVETKKDVVIVPAAAVQISPDSKFVYVMKKVDATSQPATAPSRREESGSAEGRGKDKEGAGMPEEEVELRKVEVGDQQGDDIVVLKGVEAGEEVVTDGVDKLQDGARVTVGRRGAETQSAGATSQVGAGVAGTESGSTTEASKKRRRP